MFDPLKLQQLVQALYGCMVELGAIGFRVVRCRTDQEEVFAYGAGFKAGATKPMFVKNWGDLGYRTVLEPHSDVHGMVLRRYVLQAFKGWDLREDSQVWMISIQDALNLWACRTGELLDEMALDRLYLSCFSDGPLGQGCAYCAKKLVGAPRQFERQFEGTVTYQVGLGAFRDEELQITEGPWDHSHLRSLDQCMTSVRLSPTVGYAGGPRKTKDPFREDLRRGLQGVTSVYWS